MKDKIKGLILGITIGSMITGATAFAASGININVVKKKFNIYFDDLKPVSAEGFIYKGTTYLPAKTFGEAIERPIKLDNNDLYILASKKIDDLTAMSIIKDKYDYDSETVYYDIETDSTNRNRWLVKAYEYVVIDAVTEEEEVVILGEYYVDKITRVITPKK
jgi:hypothetical protein